MKTSDYRLYRRLLTYVAPQKRALSALIAGTVVYGLTEPLVPLILQPLIDGGFIAEQLHTLYLMVGILCFGYLIRGLANFTADYAMSMVAQRVVKALRAELFRKLMHLPMSHFHHTSHGSIVSKFTYEVLQLTQAATDALAVMVRESVTIVALLVTLFYFNWKLALLLLLIAPVIALFITQISKRLRRYAQALQHHMGDIHQHLDESLRARAVIRMHNAQSFESKRFGEKIENICHYALQSSKITSTISPIIEMVIILTLSLIMIIAGHLAQGSEQVTIGRLIGFIGTMALLFPPIKRLGKISEPVQRGLAAMNSVFTFLDHEDEPNPKALPFTITAGDIELREVSFAYQQEKVLQNINLHIKAGETVAFVGASGSGKSTLAALIAGFYTPQQGQLLFDGKDSAEIRLEDRRRAIAYLTQDTQLFSGTIAENIAYADANPDNDRLQQAAQSAFAEPFILNLPDTYQHIIHDNGGQLSGGQRQRLAIARAFYQQAPILILDEATSALDNHSEQEVLSALEAIKQNRTCLIIAHRLSTIKHADKIVVMAQGKIVEIGNHQELLKQQGAYHALIQVGQAEGTR
ncbi:MAG: lipid A export permease/ATP-binding protein MsbA [Cardiobacteriaceae bacterium]|nr:lipid A export permease/ATP-binding protein MsbA [Cardiobacteriaceae bacterium]